MHPKQWLIGLGLASTLLATFAAASTGVVETRVASPATTLNIHEFKADQAANRPAILLIPGFTSHYHQDTAVFAALIPILQQRYDVYSFDWSLQESMLTDASHGYMAEAIQQYLNRLTRDVIVVSFASGNLTSSLLLQPPAATNLRAQVWIDPDVLTPSSVAFYQDYPVSWYRDKLSELLPFLAADGDTWMPTIAARTGGLYLHRETEEHLLMVAEPQTVAAFIAATVALVSAKDEKVRNRRD